MDGAECMRLARKAVKIFLRRHGGIPGVDREDVLGEALLALAKLLPRYDPAKSPADGYFVTRVLWALLDAKRAVTGRGGRLRDAPACVSLDGQPPDWLAAVEDADAVEAADTLAAVRRLLDRRDWLILRALADGRGGLADAAKRLRLSGPRVSQLKNALLARLRTAEVLELLE